MSQSASARDGSALALGATATAYLRQARGAMRYFLRLASRLAMRLSAWKRQSTLEVFGAIQSNLGPGLTVRIKQRIPS